MLFFGLSTKKNVKFSRSERREGLLKLLLLVTLEQVLSLDVVVVVAAAVGKEDDFFVLRCDFTFIKLKTLIYLRF